MSEEILKALMQLFAIIYKQDNGDEDVQNNYVKEFLLSQISLERFDIYYNQYTDYINAESSETGEVKRTSVKDSVRTLAICKRINKTLSQKQKSIVLVRITEFIHITETISPLRLELLATISDVFKIEKIEYVAESEGFEPSDPVTQIGSLANYWFQPLTHDSERGGGYSHAAWGLATGFRGWPRRRLAATRQLWWLSPGSGWEGETGST